MILPMILPDTEVRLTACNSRVLLLPLLENQDNACRLPVSWDLSRFPGDCLNSVTSYSSLSFTHL